MVTATFTDWMQTGWHFDLAMLPLLAAAALLFWLLLR